MSVVAKKNPPKIVRGNLAPPEGAQLTGELHFGQPVYYEMVPTFERVLVRDPDGKPVWMMRGDVKIKPEYELVQTGEERRDFVIEDLGNGMTFRNYDFRPDADEQRRAEERAANTPEALRRELDAMKRAFAALGVRPEDLAAIATQEQESDATPAAKRRK